MPTREQHIYQAERNERAARVLAETEASEDRLTDWEVTALFYSALHYIDAFLDSMGGIHPTNHTARNGLVASRTSFALSYLKLYNRSLDARYNVVSLAPQAVAKIIADDFNPIKENIRSLLNLP